MTIDYRAWPAISPDLDDVPIGAGTSDIRLPSPEVIAMLDDLIADDVEHDLRASEDRWLER